MQGYDALCTGFLKICNGLEEFALQTAEGSTNHVHTLLFQLLRHSLIECLQSGTQTGNNIVVELYIQRKKANFNLFHI